MKTAQKNGGKMAEFKWTPKRSEAAEKLALGHSARQVATELGAGQRSIERWKAHPAFASEVDRLSQMVDVAGRAERLRLVMRVVREKTKGDVPETDRDLLDWLKFAQSETESVRLGMAALAEAHGLGEE